jgi:L-ascorbate metabolism protein UlaG (beta-lactamase superfamily)
MTTDRVSLTLIDGPTLLIEIGGLRLLTDPTFDPPQVYTSGVLTREKFNAPSISADALLPIHAVLLSHDQHGDNLDVAGREFLPKVKTVISTTGAQERLAANTLGLEPWSSTTLALPDGRNLKITATPARHGPAGFERVNGEVIGFILSIDGGACIYVSGDTVWYSGVAEIAHRFNVKLAVLFAGAAQPKGPFNVSMNTNDAIEAAVAMPDARITAVHNLGWSHYKQNQADLVTAFSAVGLGERFQQLSPGVPVTLEISSGREVSVA